MAGPRDNDDDTTTASGRGTDGAGRARVASCPTESHADTAAAPNWFADFLIDRATRKPSEHTMKAYRQDFTAVAALLTAGNPMLPRPRGRPAGDLRGMGGTRWGGHT